MRIRRFGGKLKRGLFNWVAELHRGKDARFYYDYRDLEDYMRVSYCSLREVGFQTRCMISERIVEYPLVFQKIARPRSRILDIGSAESFLPYQLASLGHQIVASDLFPPTQRWRRRPLRGDWKVEPDQAGYPLNHPNLHFVREDATHLAHESASFDYVTAISTIEHFGCYGTRVPDPTRVGLRAMGEMHRVLKQRERLLISVPYGTGADSPRNRLLQLIFDANLLESYLRRFLVLEERYFVFRNCGWVECDRAGAARADCSTRTTGVCFVEAEKP